MCSTPGGGPSQTSTSKATGHGATTSASIARLASAADGEAWHQRYFGDVDRDFRRALSDALPGVHADDIDAGFRYSRSLFGEVLLHRCGKAGGTCRPCGFREDDIGRLICYQGNGMRGLARGIAVANA